MKKIRTLLLLAVIALFTISTSPVKAEDCPEADRTTYAGGSSESECLSSALGVHVPAGAYVPVPQVAHGVAGFPSWSVLPSGHCEQDVACSCEYEPAGQVLHSVYPPGTSS